MSSIKAIALAKIVGGGGGESTLITKTINANGVYNASSDNADGYNKVTVQLPDGDEVSY